MRITGLTVEGLRGCPRPFVLELKGKSLCLVGENGHAKTTLADAAELWSSGDIAAFHTEGCQLAAAIHLDASSATVRITGTGFSHSRTLTAADGAGELVADAPSATAQVAPIPILRHSTIAGFMGRTAGEKKKALLDLLGIGSLNGLREPLKTTVGHVKRDLDAAASQLAGERATVELHLAGEQLLAYAHRHAAAAGLGELLDTQEALLELELGELPPRAPDRGSAVDELTVALTGLPPDPAAAWNTEVGDADRLQLQGTADLLDAARRVIGREDRACPVCEQPVAGWQLLARLAERAAELREIRARMREAEHGLATMQSALERLVGALDLLARRPPKEGWSAAQVLNTARETVDRYRADLGTARAQRTMCPPTPDLAALTERLPDLREQASQGDDDAQTRALIALAELRQKCLRLAQAEERHHALATAHAATTRILELAEEEIETATKDAIERVSALAGEYYDRLRTSSPITDVRLRYKRARAGQVEFTLTYDHRHRNVSPPQRIMSTSQLNALGLALHLARLKLEDQPWRTVFLDDVVNSFDANHRQGLARLLNEEFSAWQMIVLTHDRAFNDILRRSTSGWRFREIAAFSPRGGPQLSDSEPRRALRARLDDGATPMEVAHLARRALEQSLRTPLAKLGYEIRYDPDQRYTAHDYLLALRRGLAHAGSPLNDLPLLDRMETASYMANLGVHDRDATVATTDDLLRLADDLDELDNAFHCAGCGEPVWRQHRPQHGRESFRCGCGALAA
jgi:hypothetical protein